MKIGIYNLHMKAKGGGEKRTLVLADHLSHSHRVWVFVNEPVDVPALEGYFDVDLSRVSFVALNKRRGQAGRRRRSVQWERTSESFRHFRKIKSFGLDVFVNNSYGSNLPCPAAGGIYMCMFPFLYRKSSDNTRHWKYRWLVDPLEKLILGCHASEFLSSYSLITANSQFTAEWVERLWGQRPEVIYSVCDNMGPPADKKKIILHVGRFLANGDGSLLKRQEVLLKVFSRLRGIQTEGWQLHFVGSVAQNPRTHTSIERLVETARGGPIFFHFDADLDTLRGLYRNASVYWHATGYGSTENEDPSSQEHFGMTTVEAMSAGAVPVVINSGGQKEIVHDGIDGFLWQELAGLSDQTTRLVKDPCLLQRLSEQAVASSASFGRATFTARMDELIDRFLSAAK
jgi:glycosyltransferase involved in cell wall biosynthesis